MAKNLTYRTIFHGINTRIISRVNCELLLPIKNYKDFSLMNKTTTGPVSLAIEEKIKNSLNPSYLKVINESYQHNVPPGSETHFKVVVVSKEFNELPLIKRHRLVNEILSHELNTAVHALSIVAKTPAQWEDSDQVVEKSPACRGGFGM